MKVSALETDSKGHQGADGVHPVSHSLSQKFTGTCPFTCETKD